MGRFEPLAVVGQHPRTSPSSPCSSTCRTTSKRGRNGIHIASMQSTPAVAAGRHLFGLGGVQAHELLHQHVLAGGDRQQGTCRRSGLVRRRDVDDLDAEVGDQRLEAIHARSGRPPGRRTVLRRPGCGSRRRRLAGSSRSAVRGRTVRRPSCAQDPPAQRGALPRDRAGAGPEAWRGKPVGVIECGMTDAASGDLARGDLARPPRRKATEHITGAPTVSYELREHR